MGTSKKAFEKVDVHFKNIGRDTSPLWLPRGVSLPQLVCKPCACVEKDAMISRGPKDPIIFAPMFKMLV